MSKLTTLPVGSLEVCDRTRVRYHAPKEGTDIVNEYAEAYRCGLIVEPLDVFREKGTERYIVADGEHRLFALRAAKLKEIEVRLHEGDEVAALDFAIGCNHAHGLRRTKQDKYHAFVRIMETDSLRKKYPTDTDLSEKIGVAKRTVTDYKVEWRNSESGDKTTRRKKEKAQVAAAKHNGHAHKEVKPTSEQKKVAKEVRESVPKKAAADDGWTKADDQGVEAISDALSILGKAWETATRAAQIHMRDVVAKTVRDMR